MKKLAGLAMMAAAFAAIPESRSYGPIKMRTQKTPLTKLQSKRRAKTKAQRIARKISRPTY